MSSGRVPPPPSDCRKRGHHTAQQFSIPGLHTSCTGLLGSAAILTDAGPVSCPAETLGDQDADGLRGEMVNDRGNAATTGVH